MFHFLCFDWNHPAMINSYHVAKLDSGYGGGEDHAEERW